MKIFFVLLFSLMLAVAPSLQAQQQPNLLPKIYLFKKNQYDRNGKRHGRWKFYYDAAETKLAYKGRFKHGAEKGKWKFYDHQGLRYKTERYHKHQSEIWTRFYYPNGKIEKQGKATLFEDAAVLHYFWQGPWRYYSESGALLKTEYFIKGKKLELHAPVKTVFK